MTTPIQSSSDVIWEAPSGLAPEAKPRLGRVPSAAVLGFVLGAIYALVAGTIDALLMRDVPLRLEAGALLTAMLVIGLETAALAALTAWPVEAWQGVLLGAVGLIAWNMWQSYQRVQGAALAFVPLLLPLLVLSLPIVVVLRWLPYQFAKNEAQPGPARARAQLLFLISVVVIGGFAGSWAQMSPEAQTAVRKLNTALSQVAAAPAEAPLPFAFQTLPAFRQHIHRRYDLEELGSIPGANAVDVRVTFDDGYQVTCSVDPQVGSAVCVEGAQSPYRLDQ